MREHSADACGFKPAVHATVLLALLMASPLAEPSAAAPISPGQLEILAYLRSEAGDGYLSLDENSESASEQPLGSSPAAVSNSVGAASIGEEAAATFRLEELPSTFYLNLSVSYHLYPVSGTLFWASTGTRGPAGSQDKGKDWTRIRIEIFTTNASREPIRVGGTEAVYGAELAGLCGNRDVCVYALPGWNSLTFEIPSEVYSLDKGHPLWVKVTRKSGLGQFYIGTAGPTASFVRFRYFETNPLETAAYLDGSRLQFDAIPAQTSEAGRPQQEAGQTSENAQREGSPRFGLGAAGLGTLPLLIGLSGNTRRRRFASYAMVLLLIVVLAGCVGGQSNPASSLGMPTGARRLEVEYVEGNGSNVDFGTGNLMGLVRDAMRGGVPVAGASVFILGTKLSARTVGNGSFYFGNLTAGPATVRIEPAGSVLNVSEFDVKVEPGKTARVTVFLQPRDESSFLGTAHTHSLWSDDSGVQKNWQRFDIPGLAWTDPTGLKRPEAQSCASTSDGLYGCRTTITFAEKRPVFPGTSIVEVFLDWQPAERGPKELGLEVKTMLHKNESYWWLPAYRYVPRAPGEPFRIAIFPHEADPGHQEFSNWVFTILVPVTRAVFVSDETVYLDADVGVRGAIHLYRGIVPMEPPHRNFWGPNGTLELFDSSSVRTCNSGSLGLPCPGVREFPSLKWSLSSQGKFVHPGTAEIRGQYWWTESNSHLTDDWSLWYLPANVPAAEWKAGLRKVELVPNAARFDFTIPLQPPHGDRKEVDQYYQPFSYWVFYVDEEGPDGFAGSGKSVTDEVYWYLSATAVRSFA